MGLFTRNTPADPRYVLPPASRREYYRYQRISRHEFPMMNFAYLESNLIQGINPSAVADSIYASIDWAPDLDVAYAAKVLADEVFRHSPDVAFGQDAAAAYMTDISFGILAGVYERRSNQYKKGLRHPAVWNALSLYRKGAEGSSDGLTPEQEALRIATAHLGYTQGIEPMSSASILFSRWG